MIRVIQKIFKIKDQLHEIEEHLRKNEFDEEADDIHWATLVCFRAGINLHKRREAKRKGNKR